MSTHAKRKESLEKGIEQLHIKIMKATKGLSIVKFESTRIHLEEYIDDLKLEVAEKESALEQLILKQIRSSQKEA